MPQRYCASIAISTSAMPVARARASAEPIKAKGGTMTMKTTLEVIAGFRARDLTAAGGFGTDDARVLGGANHAPDLMLQTVRMSGEKNPASRLKFDGGAQSCSGNNLLNGIERWRCCHRDRRMIDIIILARRQSGLADTQRLPWQRSQYDGTSPSAPGFIGVATTSRIL